MRSNTTRIAVVVGAIAAVVVLFAVLNSGSDNGNDNKAVINVIGGKPAGGIQKLNYTKGEQVRFRVNSDISDEIHVHGYDLHENVRGGSSVSFSFPATIEGVFVIELEAKAEQIAELRVRPS